MPRIVVCWVQNLGCYYTCSPNKNQCCQASGCAPEFSLSRDNEEIWDAPWQVGRIGDADCFSDIRCGGRIGAGPSQAELFNNVYPPTLQRCQETRGYFLNEDPNGFENH